jgi:tetratricopeptide (TPR) repeat protein
MPSLEQLQSLLAADPDDLFLRYGVAMELAKLDRSADAMQAFDELLQRDPKYVPAHFMRARLIEQSGDRDAAIAAYDAGIRIAQSVGDTHAAGEMTAARDSL